MKLEIWREPDLSGELPCGPARSSHIPQDRAASGEPDLYRFTRVPAGVQLPLPTSRILQLA